MNILETKLALLGALVGAAGLHTLIRARRYTQPIPDFKNQQHPLFQGVENPCFRGLQAVTDHRTFADE